MAANEVAAAFQHRIYNMEVQHCAIVLGQLYPAALACRGYMTTVQGQTPLRSSGIHFEPRVFQVLLSCNSPLVPEAPMPLERGLCLHRLVAGTTIPRRSY